MIVPVNYLAVVVAAVAAMVVGMAWYSPLLFGKQWMRLRGIDPASMQGMKFPAGLMVQELVATLVMAFVISQFAAWLGAGSALAGIVLGLWLWVGFVATVMFGATLWEKYPLGLFVINAGLRLVNIVLMAVIISAWQ